MGWIWQSCPDKTGSCIRQYCVLGLSAILTGVCIFACVQTIRKFHKYKFEILPLAINSLTCLVVLVISFLNQLYDTHLIMLLVEVYTYSLVCFAYVGIYVKGSHRFRTCTRIFIAFTVLVVLGIGTVIGLQIVDIVKCTEQYQIGTGVLVVLQLPIYVITMVYLRKTKKRIEDNEANKNFQQQQHLLDQNDTFIKIRYRQVQFAMLTFTISLVLHVISFFLFFITDKSLIKCKDDESSVYVDNWLAILILAGEDIAELLPHLAMPFIFYFFPEKYGLFYETIIIPKKIQKSEISRPYSNIQKQQTIRNKWQKK